MGGIVENEAGRQIVARLSTQILKPLSTLDVKSDDRSGFEIVDQLADAIVAPEPATPALRSARAAITAADEMVVNGEGDFILTERLTLVRTLAMMRAAKKLGKPVHLLNSILSYAPARPDHEKLVIDAVGETLALCDSIRYRDPASLELHRELYPRLQAGWAPDALFAWARAAKTSLAERTAFSPETEGLTIPVQRLLHGREPYVVLSGSSLADVDTAEFRATVVALRSELKKDGITLVFAGSDGPDTKYISALKGSGMLVVQPKVPLTAAARLLWNASAFVSGRYHPSILATLGGTPFVLMHSNSHKTRSLYEVVASGTAPDEHPFFAGGAEGAARIAEAVRPVLGDRRARARVQKSAVSNSKSVIRAFTEILA
jgi:polysaccharide pyruvyl transferase WcaK-like protein